MTKLKNLQPLCILSESMPQTKHDLNRTKHFIEMTYESQENIGLKQAFSNSITDIYCANKNVLCTLF